MRKKVYFVFGIIAIVLGIFFFSPGIILILAGEKDGYFIVLLNILIIVLGIWFIRKSKKLQPPSQQVNVSEVSQAYASPVTPVQVPDPAPENSVSLSQNPPSNIKWDFDINISDKEEVGGFIYHSCKTTNNNLDQLRKSFIVLDTETTGLSNYDKIVSIGAIKFVNMAPVDSFYTLVNPQMHIPEAASAINHIYDADVADAPLEGEMIRMLENFLGNSLDIIVGYNIAFDMRFLKAVADKNQIVGDVRTYDVMSLSRKMIKELKNYKQVTVANHLGINTDNAHNSLGDCEICAKILITLLNR